jgi:hypothetical protein
MPSRSRRLDYYEYLMTYVDDLIAVSYNPMGIMKEIETTFKFKGNKIEETSSYLGARLQKKNINGWGCWTITSQDNVNAAVVNVEKAIEGTKWKLPTKAATPMTSACILYTRIRRDPGIGREGHSILPRTNWDVEMGN